MPAPTPGRCKSCDAPILWVRTGTGRLMPLDAVPTDTGNVLIVDDIAGVYPDIDPALKLKRYTPHFATCPGAAAHRKPRTKAAQSPGLFGESGNENLPD